MDSLLYLLFLITGIALGAGATWIILQQRSRLLLDRARTVTETQQETLARLQATHDTLAHRLEEESTRAQDFALRLREAETRLEAEKAQLARVESIREAFAETFKALSSDALRLNNEQFLKLARENLERFQQGAKDDLDKRQGAIDRMMLPIRESLGKVDEKIVSLEKAREGAYAGLKEQILQLINTSSGLQSETANLVKALRAPQVRGRWGEMQLRRAVETAGMLEHCDFTEQGSVENEEGRQRPDMLIRLPNERTVVVDAKAPLAAYLEALETQNPDEQRRHLADHARQVRDHLKKLGAKSYWKQFDNAPEFVVLFLPGESFFSAALQHDATLIEYGMENRVVLATPTTLIALLKTIHAGWRQEAIAREAEAISRLGAELYDRVGTLASHFDDLRKGLDRATGAYNKAVSSLESRLLPTARRFRDLHATTDKAIETLESANTHLNQPTSPEMNPDSDKPG